MRLLVTILLLAALAGPTAAQDRQAVHTSNEMPGLPFSSAMRVGNLLFLAGMIGNVPGTRQLADTGVAGQTRQTIENIKVILAAGGSSLERVVKCTVYLTNIADYAAMNAVYATYFPKDPPARATVAVAALVFDARVEIECVATTG